ncbi:hypothetical protein TVCOMph1_CDS0058 [Terrisporobacter phage TVCOM_ph1]
MFCYLIIKHPIYLPLYVIYVKYCYILHYKL